MLTSKQIQVETLSANIKELQEKTKAVQRNLTMLDQYESDCINGHKKFYLTSELYRHGTCIEVTKEEAQVIADRFDKETQELYDQVNKTPSSLEHTARQE